jgi:Bacterial Ig-like domain (group 3)
MWEAKISYLGEAIDPKSQIAQKLVSMENRTSMLYVMALFVVFNAGMHLAAASTYATATALSCSPSSFIFGSAGASCTATVTAGGHTPASETITFSSSTGTGSFTPTSLSCTQHTSSYTCTAVAAYTDSATGRPTIRASYAGGVSGSNTYTSSFGTTAVTVTKATPTISVSCTPASFIAGASTTCTASVTGGSGPTGTVTFASTAGSFTGSPCTLSSGSCTVTYTSTVAAFPRITATYSGDSNNNAGTPATTTLTVNLASPTLGISCSPTSFTGGGSTTCTATLVGGSSPTGKIAFASTAGSFTRNPCTLSSGSCTVTYTSTVAAPSRITATYSGDSNNNAVISATTTVTVNMATALLSLSCPATFTSGFQITCTASVTGSNPTGYVLFSSASGSFTGGLCALSSGSCKATFTSNIVGPVVITLRYSGDSNNYPGTPASTTVTVTKAYPLAVSAQANPPMNCCHAGGYYPGPNDPSYNGQQCGSYSGTGYGGSMYCPTATAQGAYTCVGYSESWSSCGTSPASSQGVCCPPGTHGVLEFTASWGACGGSHVKNTYGCAPN